MRLNRKLSNVEHQAIRQEAASHSRQASYLLMAVSKRFAYRALITEEDFGFIYVNSAPSNPNPATPTLFILADTIQQISNNRSFLKTRVPKGLNGLQIDKLLADFENLFQTLNDRTIYLVDHAPGFPDKGPYVMDGMHTLVAYGLFAYRTFPILVHYFSDLEESM